ncbi:prepilin-type N-terminal cleavage/methylation domain-containing protein [Eggerthella guodeyinii]|uniref:Prepilin-type N-terminal cleavage/methylation domain-containing protein n=1 Tax=Eggerthella guodeyinii TaxID=2690837 RepID=A0A6L7IMV0_9ACTN|nr:prepilin-type N-terminal cleavage/methylation domain-containing protein [Eggerthella guodeyinii]QOS68333.1 prepilin-type N-terminal cleavage/methylation domain-containing protein [Eggerthella guodeyinii]
MTDRVKHTAGFTLAELMMSIAIILILAAIAIPSIFNAQSNMRMVELNNAAQSIANAAQTQMTAMKVSGTWMAFLDDRAEGSGTYLLRDEARASNILTSLSVDSTVYDGDYVIVFDRDTASVTAVFYTDGKTGFFGQAPATTNAAQTYYAGGSGSTDQTARMANDPMIGYYEGTPSGATPEVALRNPVIWVDEAESYLCIENPNLASGASWANGSALSIELTDLAEGKNSVSITISGLQLEGGALSGMFEVKSSDDAVEMDLPTSANAVQLVNRTTSSTSPTVYAIDLNALSDLIAAKSEAASTFMDNFAYHDKIQVEAQVTTGDRASVPSSAQAFIEWPEPVPRLTVLVTNPSYRYLDENGTKEKTQASHIKGTYTDPVVELVPASGVGDVVGISLKDKDKAVIRGVKTNNDKLISENVESSRQAYTGGWVKLNDADQKEANIRVTTGSYTPNGSTTETGTNLGSVQSGTESHQYQIYELWVNELRAGYLENNVWHWDGEVGEAFSAGCVDGLQEGEAPTDLTTITFNTKNLNAADLSVIPKNDAGGYDVYVRTTPKIAEVKSFFEDTAPTLGGKYLVWNAGVGTTGSRGGNWGKPVRQTFENEFGASSAVALWNVTTMRGGLEEFPASKDLRVYYSATPAVGWLPENSSYDVYSSYTALPSVVLWYFPSTSNYSWGTDVATPDAYVSEARLSEGEDGFKLVKSSSADFEIPYNSTTTGFLQSGRDELFYRVLTYCDEEGNPLSEYERQYVPYTVQNDATYAAIKDAPEKEGSIFTGWKVSEGSAYPAGKEYTIQLGEGGTTVGDHNDQLSYGAVKLIATYKEKPKMGLGLVYLEFDSNNNITGSYGYLDYKENLADNLNDGEISNWGYYIVVPSGNNVKLSADNVTMGQKSNLIEGYDTYLLSPKDAARKAQYCTATMTLEKEQVSYYVNFNFAGAVTLDENVAKVWGDSEDSAWCVRDATQFFGSLPWITNDSIQSYYASDYFLQTHDIELGSVSGYKFTNVFTGVYDGGGYAIRNFTVVTYTALGNGGYRGDSVSGGGSLQGQGLFPYVRKSSERETALKNIRLVADGASIESYGTNAKGCFGLLAGVIEGAKVENCHVEGGDGQFTLHDIALNNGVAGVLVGWVYGGEVVDSTVEGLSTSFEVKGGSWGDPIEAGGLIGRVTTPEGQDAADAKVTRCKVLNSSIRFIGTGRTDKDAYIGLLLGNAERAIVESPSVEKSTIEIVAGDAHWRKSVNLGGLVGRGSQLNESAGTVTSVTFYVPEEEEVEEGQEKKTDRYCGQAIGFADFACLYSGNTYSDIYLSVGTEKEAVADEVGRP